MFEKQDIRNYRNNVSVGQRINCLKPVGGDRFVPVEAIVIEKYPNFALVVDEGGKWKWCVMWIDLMTKSFDGGK